MAEGARKATAIMLWGILWLLTFTGLDRPIGDGDECFHAWVLLDMLRDGTFLTPSWQGAPVLDRPPTLYWLAAPFARVVPGEVGLRLASALCSFLTLVVVHVCMRRHFERADVAWASTLLLAGAPVFRGFSRSLLSDPFMTLAVTVALCGVLRAQRQPRGLRAVGAGLGAAVACKSLAAALPALALLPWLWRPIGRALRQPGPRRELRIGAALLAGLGLPFYVLGLALYGGRFWREHIELTLWQRASAGFAGIGLGPDPLAYLKSLAVFDGPVVMALLLGGSLAALGLGLLRKRVDLCLLGGFPWLLLALLSAMATKLPHYLLPLYPAMAMAVGATYAELTRGAAWLERLHGPMVAPAVVAVCVLSAVDRSGGIESLVPLPFGRALAPIAAAHSRPDQTLYAYDWYGTSLGLYARRPLILATSQPQAFAALDHGPIRMAHAARLIPPWPEPPGAQVLVAGPAAAVARAPWLQLEEELGRAGPVVLWRARVRQPPAPPAGSP